VPELLFDKSGMLELTALPANNVPYLTSKGLIRSHGEMRRGKRPHYTLHEVVTVALMERMRQVGLPYHTAREYIDGIRTKSSEVVESDGGKHHYGFFKTLEKKLEPEHVVWMTIADGKPHGMWLWLRPPEQAGKGDFALMASTVALPADGFDSYIILSVGPLIRSILDAARKHQ